MKWTKQEIRTSFPYSYALICPALGYLVAQFTSGNLNPRDLIGLGIAVVVIAIGRFVAERRAPLPLVLGLLALPFAREAQAQAKKYVMGFASSETGQPVGFSSSNGILYPTNTGAPGYFHSSHEWIVTDVNGGKLQTNDKVHLFNKQAKMYLSMQKA